MPESNVTTSLTMCSLPLRSSINDTRQQALSSSLGLSMPCSSSESATISTFTSINSPGATQLGSLSEQRHRLREALHRGAIHGVDIFHFLARLGHGDRTLRFQHLNISCHSREHDP